MRFFNYLSVAMLFLILCGCAEDREAGSIIKIECGIDVAGIKWEYVIEENKITVSYKDIDWIDGSTEIIKEKWEKSYEIPEYKRGEIAANINGTGIWELNESGRLPIRPSRVFLKDGRHINIRSGTKDGWTIAIENGSNRKHVSNSYSNQFFSVFLALNKTIPEIKDITIVHMKWLSREITNLLPENSEKN